MHGMSMVSHSASSTGAPRMPPAIAISSTPSGARKPEPMISNGWVPIEIEIGQGRPASKARCANRRMLLGVTMSMPVRFFSLTMKRYMPELRPCSGSLAMTTPAVIMGPPS